LLKHSTSVKARNKYLNIDINQTLLVAWMEIRVFNKYYFIYENILKVCDAAVKGLELTSNCSLTIDTLVTSNSPEVVRHISQSKPNIGEL
jgi:hypothetical protein